MIGRTLVSLIFAAVAIAGPIDISGQNANVAHNNVNPSVKDVNVNPNVGIFGSVEDVANNANTNVIAPVNDVESVVGGAGVINKRGGGPLNVADQDVDVTGNNVNPSVKDVDVNPNVGIFGTVKDVANNPNTNVIVPVHDIESVVGGVGLISKRDDGLLNVSGQDIDVSHNNVNPEVKDVTANPNVGIFGTVKDVANNPNTNVIAPIHDIESVVGGVGLINKRGDGLLNVSGQDVDVSHNNVNPEVKDVTANPNVGIFGTVKDTANNPNTNVIAPIRDIESVVGGVGLIHKRHDGLLDVTGQDVDVTGNNASPSVKDVDVNPNVGIFGTVKGVANNPNTNVIAPVRDVTSGVGVLDIIDKRDGLLDVTGQDLDISHNNVNPTIQNVNVSPNVGIFGTVEDTANNPNTNVIAPIHDIESAVGAVGVANGDGIFKRGDVAVGISAQLDVLNVAIHALLNIKAHARAHIFVDRVTAKVLATTKALKRTGTLSATVAAAVVANTESTCDYQIAALTALARVDVADVVALGASIQALGHAYDGLLVQLAASVTASSQKRTIVAAQRRLDAAVVAIVDARL